MGPPSVETGTSLPANGAGAAALQRHVVLSNVRWLRYNAYAAEWTRAVQRTGAVVVALSIRNLWASPYGSRSVVHLQWPELMVAYGNRRRRFARFVRFLLLMALARLRGNRVLVTVHNLVPHDAALLGRIIWRVVPHVCTDVHILSVEGWPEISATYPSMSGKRVHVIAHLAYENRTSPQAAEREHVDFLHFGALRGYKGVDDLLAAFAAGPRRHTLRILGWTKDPHTAASLLAAAQSDPHLTVDLGQATDSELHDAIVQASVVVLPYSKILNSGSAILALSLGRPILVPETPTFVGLRERVGDGWVLLYRGKLQAADLERALNAEREGAPNLGWCGPATVDREIDAMLKGH